MLTRTEEMILLSIWNLQGEAYGASIRDHLSKVTGSDWSIGSVYIPLDRLAGKGYVRSTKREPTPVRGGRSKRFYSLTESGRTALLHMRNVQNELWALPLRSLKRAES